MREGREAHEVEQQVDVSLDPSPIRGMVRFQIWLPDLSVDIENIVSHPIKAPAQQHTRSCTLMRDEVRQGSIRAERLQNAGEETQQGQGRGEAKPSK